jgi:hypothetical protein
MSYELPVLCLAADLIRSIKLRRDFDTDPFGFMASYGLSEEAMEAFYTMCSAPSGSGLESWKALSDYMWDKEIKTFNVEPLEPPSTNNDPDCRHPALYPNPKPLLYTFAPDWGKVGTMVPITVKGQGLWKSVDLFLVKGVTEYQVLAGGVPVGTYRCSHLTGNLSLAGVPTGKYDFVARNNAIKDPNHKRDSKHANKFEVKP